MLNARIGPKSVSARLRSTRSWRTGIACAAVALLAGPAMAQLTPERLYYGIDRSMPMTVETPSGAEGDASIHLYEHGGSEPVEDASVTSGRVDVASLFSSLWEREEPELLYAQLVVGGEGVGAPVVLQPMVSPTYFQPNPNNPRGQPQARPSGDTYSGIRAYVDRHAVMETSYGEVTFRMRPDQAPNTAWNFLHLARGGYYTDTIFHRIIGPAEGKPGFVVQGGDPTGTGTGGPGYFIDLEPSQLKHDVGVLSMARSSDPNHNGSQIFICLSREGTSFLDGQYTAFAEAVSGANRVRALGGVETNAEDRPTDPPRIKKIELVDAPPFGERPEPISAQSDSSSEPAR